MFTDLAVETFLLLRNKFFDAKGNPVSFPLRDKRNTQDDPLDEYISEILKRDLPSNATCIKAPGPLITWRPSYLAACITYQYHLKSGSQNQSAIS